MQQFQNMEKYLTKLTRYKKMKNNSFMIDFE